MSPNVPPDEETGQWDIYGKVKEILSFGVGDITADKVTATETEVESLTDNNDGQAWETLRELGYESGDFVAFYSAQNNGTATVSSNNYQTANLAEFNGVLDHIFPTAATLEYAISAQFDDNNDQIDVRLRDNEQGVTAVEQLDVTASSIETFSTVGPGTAGNVDTSAPSRLFPEIRNSDNTTSVTIRRPTILIGVTL